MPARTTTKGLKLWPLKKAINSGWRRSGFRVSLVSSTTAAQSKKETPRLKLVIFGAERTLIHEKENIFDVYSS